PPAPQSDAQQGVPPRAHHAQRHRTTTRTHPRPEGTQRQAHTDASTAPSWEGSLPNPEASAVRRNPFRKTARRVRFQGTDSHTIGSTPSCGMADARCDTKEEQRPTGQDRNYPEPWVEKFLERELSRFDTLAGVSHIAEHSIVMRNDRPIKQRYHPRNPAMRAVIDRQIDELLREGRIEPSKSLHSAPIVIAAKKNGDVRMCRGLFHWKVMPFGLHSAPATFQRALDTVIGPDMEPHAFAYLDDIIVIGATLEEHVQNLRDVFRRLRA
ncbi:hypothetical protein KR054_009968, partial [Drosophila jambulina]